MTFEAYRMLRKLGEEWGISENQATERAIREAHRGLVEDRNDPEPESERDELVEYLKGQLRIRDEEIRRRDHLMAAALERIPALGAGSGENSGDSKKSEAHKSVLKDSEDQARGRGREETERKAWWMLWRN